MLRRVVLYEDSRDGSWNDFYQIGHWHFPPFEAQWLIAAL